MNGTTLKALNTRIVEHARGWRVSIERTVATPTAVIVYGTRARRNVVLKVVKEPGDEWHSGAVAAAFGGRGVARVYEHTDGAVLLERLLPGEPLVTLVRAGEDDAATQVLATLIGQMSPLEPPPTCPTAADWGAAFTRHLATNDDRLPRPLVEYAQRIYAELCLTERNPALLHGDLHHYNVLRDDQRGWVAIDPKGVVGELEYEVGAALRNPVECVELVASLDVAERRLDRFGERLGIDVARARGWAFAQAVLSVLWSLEDGDGLEGTTASLRLAQALERSPALRAEFPD